MLLNDRFVLFDLSFQTILGRCRVFLVFQLFFCDDDSNFVAGDVGEDANLTIACHVKLSSQRIEFHRDDVVVENSIDLNIQITGQAGENLNVCADGDRDDLSRIGKRNQWCRRFDVISTGEKTFRRFTSNIINYKKAKLLNSISTTKSFAILLLISNNLKVPSLQTEAKCDAS